MSLEAPWLKDCPEFIELEIAESVASRTETLSTFRELGPPDLCHIIKSPTKVGTTKDSGSYHYVSGVDASSSASIAIYLNELLRSLDLPQGWFTPNAAWKVRSGTYCCYNAFSRLDVRVQVSIPGGVDSYAVDLRGQRHELSSDLWLETYLSAHLRAILYADDPNYKLYGYRKFDPIPKPEDEEKFLAASQHLFHKGWQLGSDPEIQVATPISNHLTTAILKYFGDSGRMSRAANLFEKIAESQRKTSGEKVGCEVDALTAKAYIGMNEETLAIRTLNRALNVSPQSWPLLHVQVDFLRSKGQHQWAVHLARQAVECSPSEFVTWAKLTDCLIDIEDFEGALLTLNSCPMFTYNERDLHRMPTPIKNHFPIQKWVIDSQLIEDDSPKENEADITLLRLPAPSLRGTFARAYELLTRLNNCIGWDDLLKIRSNVFVMEEEYRQHKSDDSTATIITSDNVSAQTQTQASNEVIKQPAIPTIKISSDSDHEREQFKKGGLELHMEDSRGNEGNTTDETVNETSETNDTNQSDNDSRGLSFSDKKLCERWLDNLMLVLYEDLRVLTIYKAERSHFKSQQMQYRKTGTEWEIIGDLCLRMHNKEDAKEAYQRCLDLKFSAKSFIKLLEIFANQGDTQRAFAAAIRLTAYNHRWYNTSVYPNAVSNQLFKIVRTEGVQKLKFMTMSLGNDLPIQSQLSKYWNYIESFKVEGEAF
ncbi:bud site selection-related protein [Wallemia mellicola]|uniref:Bud site selection-related protein n=1 Tax=Wallemia mellicola TaxID=1708541 RepID=A0A4T0P059_9BASI|nr:bud site selection-related protein [Wallemia mellicola]